MAILKEVSFKTYFRSVSLLDIYDGGYQRLYDGYHRWFLGPQIHRCIECTFSVMETSKWIMFSFSFQVPGVLLGNTQLTFACSNSTIKILEK